MGCAALFCIAAGANTEVCPDAFHGCRGEENVVMSQLSGRELTVETFRLMTPLGPVQGLL